MTSLTCPSYAVAVRSKARVCSGSSAGIAGSNATEGTIFDSCACCVFCDKLITHAEESGLMCLIVCGLETSTMGRSGPSLVCCGTGSRTVVRLCAKTGYTSGSNQNMYFAGASLESKVIHLQDGLTCWNDRQELLTPQKSLPTLPQTSIHTHHTLTIRLHTFFDIVPRSNRVYSSCRDL